MEIELKNISKQYGKFYAVKNVSFTVQSGECFFLLGPSGCGKTTILRIIAGFVEPDTGAILFNEKDVTTLPPNKRNCGMIFQNYALWPHMTVYGNIEFALKASGRFAKQEIAGRIDDVLQLIHMSDMAKKMPLELSGGQQQRVALARALSFKPSILLLDEPLSNLDAKLRVEMRVELRKIIKELNITAIYVTHDQIEALSIADRCAIMRNGVIEQIACPDELYFKPLNFFVATFMGETNVLEGSILNYRTGSNEIEIQTPIGIFVSKCFFGKFSCGDKIKAVFRPESVNILNYTENGINTFAVKIIDELMLGSILEYKLIAGDAFIFKAHSLNHKKRVFPNKNIFCRIMPEDLMIFKSNL